MSDQELFYQQKLDFEMDSADLFRDLKGGKNIVIIDTRSEEKYKQEHIPNAISFPHSEINSDKIAYFDKNLLYVTYCDGIGCNGSTKGALKLAKLGFNVKELIGGLDWWKRDGYETKGTKSKEMNSVSCGC